MICSRSARLPYSYLTRKQTARHDCILSASDRNFSFANDSVKCSGAGSKPASSTEIRPPGSIQIKLAMKLNPVVDTQPPVEVNQIRAAAQQNVLAVVDRRTAARRRR